MIAPSVQCIGIQIRCTRDKNYCLKARAAVAVWCVVRTVQLLNRKKKKKQTVNKQTFCSFSVFERIL